MKRTGLMITSLATASLYAVSAGATDGYFQHGYGLISKSMGGAGTALAVDTFGGASNPAKGVFVGDRIDLGVDFFSPQRSAARSGGSVGIDGSADSDSTLFAVPEFGYNKMLGADLALGVSIYANGGMNTDYPGGQIPGGTACSGFNAGNPTGPYNLLCGSGRLGVDLSQLIVSPTLSYKLSERHAIGVAPLFGFQRFSAEGLDAFSGFSTAGADLTNRGYDNAYGYGVRIGWLGQMTDSLSVGAAYSSKIQMTEFDKYKGLFAEQGDFDMPENYNIGIALKASPVFTLVADYQRINYSDVKAVGNPSSRLSQCMGGDVSSCLGGDNGAGFGWTDIDVWKLGFAYQINDKTILRAGYNHTDNPVQASDVTFNILAPGVVQDHVTLGMTLGAGNGEWTFAYMHAFENSVSGQSLFNGFGAASGNETIQMSQNAFGVAYAWKLQ